ncbi:MAG TPA: NAD(P)-dependent oxidoreductase [Clostridia bacterium]
MKDGVKRVFVVDTSDQRLKTVKELLQKDGFEVLEFASGQKYLHNSHIQHIFIFPPYVPIDYKIANALSLDSVVFGLGCFDQEAQKALKEKSIIARFYNNDEILVMKNAYLTAEGALAAIINNTPKALKCQKILILGYGRVGKALAKILDDLRAEVSVATNDKQEFAHAAVYLQNTYTLDNFDKDLAVFDVIINTVPKMILKGERLQHIRKDAFVIDLASLPGGVDIEAAKNLGINCLHYLGVPAKTAAQTAGLYLYESVKRALEEIGEGL